MVGCQSSATNLASNKPNFKGVPYMADEPDPALTGAAFDLANAGYTTDAGSRQEKR